MSDLSAGAMGRLFGVRIITNPYLTETVPHPRSIGRSKRRAAMGHRQHYTTRPMRKAITLPDGTIIVHPAMADVIRRLANQR